MFGQHKGFCCKSVNFILQAQTIARYSSRFTLHVSLFCAVLLSSCASQPAPTHSPILPSLVTPAFTNPPPFQASPTPIRTRPELTVCLSAEPQSLYRFAVPEPGRQHILAALEEDVLTAPPSLRVETVTVRTGEKVVDSLGRVQAAAPGLVLTLLEGEVRMLEDGAEWQLPQMRVHFTLRPSLQWSDGLPLTAADFVLGFETARAVDSFDARRTANERTSTIRALSETELEWVGLPGYITSDYAANLWPPLPVHQFANQTAAEIVTSEAANRAPLSYGPFRLAEWRAGEFIRLERNPFYWRAAEGRPYLQSVIYVFNADEVASCDVIPSGQGVSEVVAALGLAAQQVPSRRADYVHFNLALELLADVRVRRALGQCAQGDSATASRALEELGWVDGNSDGVREQNNQPLAFSLATGPQTNTALVQTLMQNFQACGVSVSGQPLTEGEWLADWPDGLLFGRRFELALITWPPIQQRFPCEVWQTEQIPSDANPAGINVSGYSNAEFDAACRRLQTALDGESLAAWETRTREIINSDVPAVEVGRSTLIAYVRPTVSGIQLEASVASELGRLEDVLVAP